MTDRVNQNLLPQWMKTPLMLVWVLIIPQLVLLLMNVRSFWLISNEIEAARMPEVYWIFTAQCLLVITAFALWQIYRTKKTGVGWAWNLLLLTAHIGYLWYAGSHLEKIIPPTIEPWILDQGAVILHQFTFMMPGLFYAGLRLACFEMKLTPRSDFGFSILVAVAAPALYYLFFMTLGRLWRPSGMTLPAFVISLFFILVTVLAFVGIIRAVVLAYNYLQTKGELIWMFFSGAVCVVGPLAGLLLNRTFPFPADFQTPWVYTLAIINGLIVMIPSSQKTEGRGMLLFARSATFPFTFYFFLVFLPFLPLALPAMFALGTGFLFLVPVVLFLFHAKKLFEDFRNYCHSAAMSTALLITMAGLAVLPAYFTLEAMRDKGALAQALEYVYAPDYTSDFSFNGSVKSVKRTLIHLKEFKEGLQLPYLSGFYNSLVFEGMVLPDKKMEYMYQFFSGEELSQVDLKKTWEPGRGRNGWFGRAGRLEDPDRQVELVSVHAQSEQAGDVIKSRVRLEMHNTGSSNRAEFLREMRIPVGVLITGFKLKVGDEVVPGQIFEKRAAMWVYHMIRDYTRRDPGILTYQSPSQVNLNVYPLLAGETRVVEIEFGFPAGQAPVIFIGDKEVDLARANDPAGSSAVIIGAASPNQMFAVFSNEALARLPRVKREPYFHFILDASKRGSMDNESYRRLIQDMIRQHPSVKRAKISAVHFNTEELTPSAVPLKSAMIDAALAKKTLAPQGNLDIARTIKQELARNHALQGFNWGEYPVFVRVTRDVPPETPATPEDMPFFSRLLPEANEYWVATASGKTEKSKLWPKGGQEDVIILRSGSAVAVLPSGDENMLTAFFQGPGLSPEIAVYDPAVSRFVPLTDVKTMIPDGSYARGLGLMARNLDMLTNPAWFDQRLTALVDESRASGVMVPSTSYIVLERSSQWKTLQLKERQRLGASQGLEFEEDFKTPAPSWWLLALVFFVTKWLRERFKKRNDFVY